MLAGGNMTIEMHSQIGDRSCTNQAIGGNHYGPVLVYMSKVTDTTTDPGSGS
jgi:cellulase